MKLISKCQLHKHATYNKNDTDISQIYQNIFK